MITDKGQVTIPKQLREALGMLPGTEVEFIADGEQMIVRRVSGGSRRGRALVMHMRGRATTTMSTDQIMALTRP